MPPTDSAHLPISVKGVLWTSERHVVLLHNERDEWELPGGRVDPEDASLAAALARELAEELQATHVVVGQQLHDWIYEPVPGRRVRVVAFAVEAQLPDQLWHSHEHDAVGAFSQGQLVELALPNGYREAISRG